MFIAVLCLQLLATQLIRFYIGEKTLKGYLLTFPPTGISQKITESSFWEGELFFQIRNTEFTR
jgi:hypothetical protein